MKKIAVVLLALVFSTFAHSQGNQLKNGTYYVQYDRKFKEQYPSFKLTINGNKVIIIEPDGKNDAQIEWISQNQFRIVREGEKQDSLSYLQKQLLTLGEPYYEITKRTSNKISFIFRHNPQILIYSGVIIREK